jgi:hypothetical protein
MSHQNCYTPYLRYGALNLWHRIPHRDFIPDLHFLSPAGTQVLARNPDGNIWLFFLL